jgi:prepilin-type N-terminal cleavage/methylation domain-containing protein/prepilin-type processing-associated H-X9-DG protein
MSKQPNRSSKPSRGFTLIELLVVITIIGVMVALLLPSLGRARETAQSMKCQASMKQFGFAWTVYSNDWRGIIPGWRYGWPRSKSFPRYLGVDTGTQAGKLVACPANPFRADNYTQQFSYYADYLTNIRETRSPAEGFWTCETPVNNGTASYTIATNLATTPAMWFGHPNSNANLLFLDCHISASTQERIPLLNDTGGFRYPGFTKFWRPFLVPAVVAPVGLNLGNPWL